MTDEHYMQQAIDLADYQETPYAALLLEKTTGAYILEANSTRVDGKTAHAEMNVIRRMEENGLFSDPAQLILYTTGEPCPMCMGAIIWTGITEVHYGVSIEEIKDYHKQIDISSDQVANKSWLDVKISGGLRHDDCLVLFDKFSKP